jgi:DNA invertase Pin-like site-specific DNA recombinase
MKIGYIRVSTKDQNPERQIEKMRQLGVEERFLFVEKQSGKDFDREIYKAMCAVLREGDLLYIDSVDRLGRNYEGIKNEWFRITREIRADVVALDMPDLFDSRKFRSQGDVGKLLEDQMLSLLAWVAEQERKKILSRQLEGIAIAKREGKYKGRKPIDIDESAFQAICKTWRAGEITGVEAAKRAGLKKNTFYRRVKQFDQ